MRQDTPIYLSWGAPLAPGEWIWVPGDFHLASETWVWPGAALSSLILPLAYQGPCFLFSNIAKTPLCWHMQSQGALLHSLPEKLNSDLTLSLTAVRPVKKMAQIVRHPRVILSQWPIWSSGAQSDMCDRTIHLWLTLTFVFDSPSIAPQVCPENMERSRYREEVLMNSSLWQQESWGLLESPVLD